jgi:hypothetical protein
MSVDSLREEVLIEVERLASTVHELQVLSQDLAGCEPTLREKAAAAVFLAQFYTGIENILKRICHFMQVPLPGGETWHVELFKRFCDPSYAPLPVLFDNVLAASLAPFRKFRHVVYHGYAIELDWLRMREGIEGIADVWTRFHEVLTVFLDILEG